MSFTIRIEPEARDDIQEAINWYNERESGLGKQFHAAVKVNLDKLRLNPYYQFRYENVRCLPMEKYPYMIHFTIEENKAVVVQAVFSTHRDPVFGRKEGRFDNFDALVSWNFKHTVNLKRIRGYNAVNLKYGWIPGNRNTFMFAT